MNILDMMMNSGNGDAVRQISSRLGLDETQTASALSALVPALASGVQRNVQAPGGLEGLAAALTSGNHQRYIDNPDALNDPAAVDEGNGILGHVFGSKDVSRDVAAQAAAQTGIGADVLKKLLPLAATMMMGAIARQHAQTGATAPAGQVTAGGLAGMLGGLLGQSGGGSAMGGVSGMLGKILGR
jgi:hypothetical protein